MKFLNNLDLQFNELQNFRVQNLASAPSTAVAGQHYFNTTDGTEYVYNGTTWVNALSEGNYTFGTGLSATDREISLDAATASSLGGVIIGDNINVSEGTISVNSGSKTQAGILALATDEEAAAGEQDTKAVTAKQVNDKIAADIANKIELTDISASGAVTYNNTTGAIGLTMDTVATTDSTNLLSSGTIKAALDTKLESSDLTDLTDDITANTAAIEAEVTRATAAEGVIAGNVTTNANAISAEETRALAAEAALEARVEANETALSNLEDVTDDISALDTRLTTAEGTITTNTGAISTNAEAIAENAEAIAENAEAIATNATAISDLGTSVAETYIPLTQKGAANGVATLDAAGQVPAAQLPSYVDDVVELLTIGTAPASCAEGDMYYNTTDAVIYTATGDNTWGTTGSTAEASKIYVTIDTNESYRWSGSAMVQIGADKLKGVQLTIAGDGETTTFSLAHNLGTRNVVFEIYEAASPYEKVYVQVLHTSTTNVDVVFSQAPAVGVNYTVAVIAIV